MAQKTLFWALWAILYLVFLFSVSSLLWFFYHVQFTKHFLKHGESSECIWIRPVSLSGGSGGEKLLLLTSLSSESRSDLVGLLKVNAAKSKHERLHAGKTLYKFIFFIVTMHFVILKVL